jgi:gliding motility-associated lipoprotein GldH
MKKIIPLLSLLLIASCAKHDISKTESFADNRWAKDDVKTFTFKVEETCSGAVEIVFSHISEPGYTNVPVEVNIQDPSGKKETIDAALNFADESGKQTSDCAGDVCDYTKVIKEKVLFEKGSYTVTVKNKFNAPYLPNALAIGVLLRMKRK